MNRQHSARNMLLQGRKTEPEGIKLLLLLLYIKKRNDVKCQINIRIMNAENQYPFEYNLEKKMKLDEIHLEKNIKNCSCGRSKR